jgi:hypothetical protein
MVNPANLLDPNSFLFVKYRINMAQILIKDSGWYLYLHEIQFNGLREYAATVKLI